MKIKTNTYAVIALATLATLATVSPVLAESQQINEQTTRPSNRAMMRPVVLGTVVAISGQTITISGNQGFGANTPATTYTIDATNAKITKDKTVGTITSILVGDKIMVSGTITGTSVVATNIRDGLNQDRKNEPNSQQGKNLQDQIIGNGMPIIGGTVTSVSGNTIVITNSSQNSYTIDASSATLTEGQNTITISNITVGDVIIAQGTINGNSMTATSVRDQKKMNNPTSSSSESTNQPHQGFFGRIGSFFKHMFGF